MDAFYTYFCLAPRTARPRKGATGGEKHPHHYRPGTVALREIKTLPEID